MARPSHSATVLMSRHKHPQFIPAVLYKYANESRDDGQLGVGEYDDMPGMRAIVRVSYKHIDTGLLLPGCNIDDGAENTLDSRIGSGKNVECLNSFGTIVRS